jgi:hypothetical protein
VKQKILTNETDNGYSVEVYHDTELVWTDFFKTKGQLDWFLEGCNHEPMYLSPDEARIQLKNGEPFVNLFYRHPLGYRFAFICNHRKNNPDGHEKGYGVGCVNEDDMLGVIDTFTLSGAFKVIKRIERANVKKHLYYNRKTDEDSPAALPAEDEIDNTMREFINMTFARMKNDKELLDKLISSYKTDPTVIDELSELFIRALRKELEMES